MVVLTVQIFILFWLVKSRPRPERNKGLDDALARMQSEISRLREDIALTAKHLREETGTGFSRFAQDLQHHFATMTQQTVQTLTVTSSQQSQHQQSLLSALANQLQRLTEMNEQKLERMRNVIEQRLAALQADNEKKLEQMRQTVDEKLNATLEQRLASSFQQVSERLEAVHKGLGEMQTLANQVGDLKRVLSNVKLRGTFGETQLELLLEQLLSPEQYEKNVAPKPHSNER
ncbi:MAG: DNA recombination protein RmuC, partial [Alicyclobacillus sp.]|nr:DNA recombination protein RmuC [Alicyclobacillus sp.]